MEKAYFRLLPLGLKAVSASSVGILRTVSKVHMKNVSQEKLMGFDVEAAIQVDGVDSITEEQLIELSEL